MAKIDFSNSYLSSLCLELYLTTKAGISVPEGLLLVAEQEDNRFYQQVLQGVVEQLDNGSTLVTACRGAAVFPEYFCDMLALGEETGNLEQVFAGLNKYYDRQEEINKTVVSSVFYPAILFVTMMVVVLVLIIKVLPIFNDVFQQLGREMSSLAMFFLNLGTFLAAHWLFFLLLGLVLLVGGCLCWFVPQLKQLIGDFWSAKTKLGRQIGATRLADALAMTLQTGVDVDTALEQVAHLTSLQGVKPRVEMCRQLMVAGASFIAAAEKSQLFTVLYCRMLSIGIKTGSLDVMMEEIARRQMATTAVVIEKTIGRVEPILVVVMCVLIGIMLLSVMLPLMGIMSVLG